MPSIYAALRQLMLPLSQIDAGLPNVGRILDVGCGQGVIATYVARRPTRTVIGIDADAQRIDKASRGNRLPNLSFEVGDATHLTQTGLDGIVISDVLHHLGSARAIPALEAIAGTLGPGGVLIVKEVDRDEFIRSRLSILWDRLLYPKDKTWYFSQTELERLLTSLGFKVVVSRPNRLLPGSTTLFVGVKA